MQNTKICLNSVLALFLTVSIFTSCRKEDQQSPEQPATQPVQEMEDHLTITPERQKVIDYFNQNNPNGKGNAELKTKAYRNFNVVYTANVPQDIVRLVELEIDQLYTTSTTAATRTKMTGARINVGSGGGLFYTGGQVYIGDFNTLRQVHNGAGNVIFHELFHYLHDRHVSGGFNNSTINSYYLSARQRQAYPAGSYVLYNKAEYFATSSEGYYTGTSRPPYNAATVTSRDPNLANYLTTNF